MAGPSAILFDGTTDQLLRGADLTGIVDGKTALFSSWIRLDNLAIPIAQRILVNATIRFDLRISGGAPNSFTVSGQTSSGGIILTAVTADQQDVEWHHVLLSIDLANGVVQIYVDDISDAQGITAIDDLFDVTARDWSIGSNVIPGNIFEGALADLYFSTEFLDLTVEANRRKFIDAAGSPVYLGDNGELPTGTASIIYLRGEQTDQDQ